MAQDRIQRKSVTNEVGELRGKKITKRMEERKAKEALQREETFGTSWSVFLNVTSCLGVLALLGAPLLV